MSLSLITFDRGDLSTVAYCSTNHPRSDGAQGQFLADHTWTGWRCRLDDNTAIPIDMQLACRQQYPPLGPFGGAQFAVHNSNGYASWHCFGALLHGW